MKAEPPDGTDAEILAGEGNQLSNNTSEKFIHSQETVIKAEPEDEISYEVADNQQFDSLDEKFKCKNNKARNKLKHLPRNSYL